MHHRLHPGADRLKAGRAKHVERCDSQCGNRFSAITSVAVSIFIVLDVLDPVPTLNAPGISYQLQQGLPLQVPVAANSTIQLVPLQASLMCAGACFARSVQVMLRPWLIS